MLRSVAAYVFAAALLMLSTSAFPQAVSELRQTEPGSLLFGVLQLVIGTSAVTGAVGLVKRARWAAGAVAVWGIATGALLAAQPLFTPMDADAQRSIWMAAAALGVAAAGVSWFARRVATRDAEVRTEAARLSAVRRAPVQPANVRHDAAPSPIPLDSEVPNRYLHADES